MKSYEHKNNLYGPTFLDLIRDDMLIAFILIFMSNDNE